jgi:lambda family phage portal protein
VRSEAVKPPHVLAHHRARVRAEYAGGTIQRHNANWIASHSNANQALRYTLTTMRARSRSLERDDPLVKRFLALVETNVVGAQGVSLQSRVGNIGPDGRTVMDAAANRIFEREYALFSRRGEYDVTGQLGRAAYERLLIRTIARDGEVLEKIVSDPTSRWGFRLQMIEADWLDETLNEDRPDGSRIIMGVELSPAGRPVAYWLRDRHPGDSLGRAGYSRTRYSADVVRHYFVPMRPEQVRGVPWIHAAMTRLYQMGEYNEAAIIAARIGAEKVMMLKETEPGAAAAMTDGEENDGTFVWRSSKGAVDILPAGTEPASWVPNYPDANYGPFVLAGVRGIASGLNVAYESLSNDRQGVTWTSIRHAVLDDRDSWTLIQDWLIDSKSRDTYSAFLSYGFLSPARPFDYLPASKIDKFNAPSFQGRRWDWVNPKDDVEAKLQQIKGCLTSHRRVLAERGIDLEDLLIERQQDRALAAKYGVDLDAAVQAPNYNQAPPAPVNGEIPA